MEIEAALIPAPDSTDPGSLDRFLDAARRRYAPMVRWRAPARRLEVVGREAVIELLLREARGMRTPEFTCIRRTRCESRVIDEYAVRFLYAGEGIDAAPIAALDLVELNRVRIFDLDGGSVSCETCIENWVVLRPAAEP